MLSRKWLAGGLLVTACGVAAVACGPFFPWQLLDNRGQTLKATPVNSFAFEASHFAPAPKDKLKPVELAPYSTADDAATQLGEGEAAGLSKADVTLLQAARGAANGEEAYAKGVGLPESVRLYTAGAVAFKKGDTVGAKTRFDMVVGLPEKAGAPRAVWAAYMLGRIAKDSNDGAGATATFQKARILALKGAPDPLGLAVASYGEEARLHLNAAEAMLEATGGTVATPDASQPEAKSDVAKFAGSVLPDRLAGGFRIEMRAAADLYAYQAARGSDSGVQSLRIMAGFLLDRPDRMNAAVSDPVLGRLMVAYVLKRLDYDTIHIRQWWTEDTAKAGTGDKGLDAQLPALIAAVAKQPHPPAADRLAALCYNLGNWKCAADFAGKTGTPLAAWIKAKLATQKGDLAGAAGFYAEAAKGFPTSDALDDDSKKALIGEAGVVALARGGYVDALDKLWPVARTYWPDVAYLSERVLTTDELKRFVDAGVPAGNAPAKSTEDGAPADVNAALRDLLARRLMRDGRYGDAFGYFHDPKVLAEAKAYAAALKDGGEKWGKVDRAEALFKAATIARQSGLEILGTEGPPDSFYTGGEFEEGIGRAELKGDYVTSDEHKRFAASKAEPGARFHYRYIAINEASRAADLLPARSQAFAAVLCHATSWSSRDENRAKALWKRYVKEGARVPFAKIFGSKCPAPDFASAIKLERKIMVRDARRFVSHHRWWFAGGGATGLLAIAGLIVWLVRRKKTV